MTEEAEKLMSEFKINVWQTPDLEERLFELTNNSQDVYSFCKYYLNNFENAQPIFHELLSYIEKEQFAELIILALDILKKKQIESAHEVIQYASLQFPDLLHEYLELIFELKIDEPTSWRNLLPEKIKVFKDKLQSSETLKADKQKLFNCLLETRDLETIKFAFHFALNTKLFDSEEDYLISLLENVGFTKRNSDIESYCPNPTNHFCFPENYFSDENPIHINKVQHPTWKLKPTEYKYTFGGLIKDDENNPFTHLITFEIIPKNIKISDLEKLTLGLHIRELNDFGPIFYKHDALGHPQRIDVIKEVEISDDFPIKKTEISLSKTPERWRFQSHMFSDSRENLFRFGGEPTWIQTADVLTCPICNEKMDFLMQLDSGLPDINEGKREIWFGSGGICYVFWCDKSKVSGYYIQYT